MGVTNSKSEKSDALRLCKGRKKFIKKAIKSRYDFAAAHVSYIQSLKNVGIALRQFAEADIVIDSSLTTAEIDKTPSQSSYPSPSPPHVVAGISTSSPPASTNGSPFSPSLSRLSYMTSNGTCSVTVSINPHNISNSSMYEDDGESMVFPPPPPPEFGSSWDFFDPRDDGEGFRFVKNYGLNSNFDDVNLDTRMHTHSNENDKKILNDFVGNDQKSKLVEISNQKAVGTENNSSRNTPMIKKDLSEEREDPSEFITHRAKDFVSSIKDIEHRFFRASESGKVVSRMLEANKIRVGYSETKGKSHASAILANIKPKCCRGKTRDFNDSENVTKVITWKRSTSSRSSSSRNPLTKDDTDGSESEFVEEFCMIAGSHSSTLDRLYAWERKLYDEIKVSECIRKEYDRKCELLKEQCAKDKSSQVIDKTRSVVKDLHSRIRVAFHAVDSISKRIEKMRDEELQPQLVELIQGFIGMWKSMLECHHAQYITISLAYHSKNPSNGTRTESVADSKKQTTAQQLQQEIECFGLSFADCTNRLTSYVESLNSWLQNCILQPREKKGRRAFSPRRVVGPPIISLCRDWTAGIKSLPSQELSNAIKGFLADLHLFDDIQDNIKGESNDNEEGNDENLNCVHGSLTKVLDRLTKFSESSLKMYEDIRLKTDSARNSYLNYKPPRSMSI